MKATIQDTMSLPPDQLQHILAGKRSEGGYMLSDRFQRILCHIPADTPVLTQVMTRLFVLGSRGVSSRHSWLFMVPRWVACSLRFVSWLIWDGFSGRAWPVKSLWPGAHSFACRFLRRRPSASAYCLEGTALQARPPPFQTLIRCTQRLHPHGIRCLESGSGKQT